MADKIGREGAWTIGCFGFAACYAILILMREAPSLPLFWLMIAAQGLAGLRAHSRVRLCPGRPVPRQELLDHLWRAERCCVAWRRCGAILHWPAPRHLRQLRDRIPCVHRLELWSALLAIWIAAPRRARRRNAEAAG